jgi:FMN phosphatase YigB (HAD superfamily)
VKPITIFFDIGGTLLDGPDLFEYLTRRLSTQWPDQRTCDIIRATYFQSFPKREDFSLFRNIQETLAIILVTLSSKYGYPDISYQSRNLCLDVYGYKSNLFPDTMPVLEKLFKAGVKMIIASDNDFAILEISLKKHNLAGC